MSFLNEDASALPHASPGPAPVLGRVQSSSASRPAPFSQPLVPQTGGPSGPPSFNFQVLRSLRMHTRLAVLVGLGVCLLLLGLGLEQPRTYTASSVIYVEPMVARSLNEQGAPGFDQFRYGSFLDQQMQTIVRPDVLTAALRTLPAGTWRGPLESEQSAAARLAKALTVERALTSYQITVQLKASKPEDAAAIVNAVTNAYLQRGREDEFKQADLREQILSEERDRVKQELETDRNEQAALGASMGLASPADGAGNPYDADLANLRSQLATARQARDVAAAQLESVSGDEADKRSGLNASAEELINTDPGLSAKKSAVNARRVVLESMMAGMTPSNPQYRQAQDEIADLDRALEAKTVEVRAQTERRIEDKLRTDLQRTADVESKINGQLAQATSKATGAGPKLQRAAELANDIQRLTARYTTVDDALNALEIETNGPGMAHVPLPAAVPLSPDTNHRDLFFLAALPLGLIFGVSAAVIARMRDRRVYLGSDLQETVGFAPIAVLPAREDVSQRVINEYVLRLAAGVESAYRTAGAQSFVVTAVSAGTSTDSLLGDLSARLEDLRLRVLVLTASELLIPSQETIEHRIAGGAQSAAGEGIASAKLDRMKGQYDIILINAAPVLHSAEAEYAARCADATILVAESAVTQTNELAAATRLLSRLRVAGVGAVLDQVKLEQADEPFRSAVRVIEERIVPGAVDRKQKVKRETGAEGNNPVRPASELAEPIKLAHSESTAGDSARIQPQPVDLVEAKEAPSTKFESESGLSVDSASRAVPEATKGDDPNALGRFVGEKDRIESVPSYTRSKIRLAFKEQEVNSKTTWFSKLFRGDPPPNFRIIPDGDAEMVETPQPRWEQPPFRVPEPVAVGDPELSHLLNRIKPSGETKIAPRPRVVVAAEPDPAPVSPLPVPFMERRTTPRPIEIDEYRAPLTSPPPVSLVHEVPLWKPSVPASLVPPLPLAPASFAVPAPPEPGPQPTPEVPAQTAFDTRPSGRPLRPLTFQQLAGSIDAEALPEQTVEPVARSVRDASPQVEASERLPPGFLSPVAPTFPPLPATGPLVPVAPVVPPASHTGVPMWPAKEPIVSSYASAFRAPQAPPAPEPAPSSPAADVQAADNELVATEALVPRTAPAISHVEPEEARAFFLPSPSTRRASFVRIPIMPGPLSDPSPAPRPYRLETANAGTERPSTPDLAPQASAPYSVATVPGGMSFPPDHQARHEMFGRRKTDRPGGTPEIPGLTRRWKLLSQFEPVVTDPLPAHRKGYTRSTDFNPPRRSDEG